VDTPSPSQGVGVKRREGLSNLEIEERAEGEDVGEGVVQGVGVKECCGAVLEKLGEEEEVGDVVVE